jgi:hypothetical protein
MGVHAYQLASNATIAANANTAPVVSVIGGTYLWNAQFTGTSLVLQSLGADGVTWGNVATLSASGTTTVLLGAYASVRLSNPNGSALNGVYSNLS